MTSLLFQPRALAAGDCVGAASGGVMSLTLISHASSSISPPKSVTSSLNDIVSSGELSSGADAVIDTVVKSGGRKATGPPSVWIHEYAAMPSSGSLEVLPSSVKSAPSSTDAGHVTEAAGAAFCHSTLTICSVEDCSVPSETVSLNLSDVPSGYGANGAVNVAIAVLELLNSTAVPSSCVQE